MKVLVSTFCSFWGLSHALTVMPPKAKVSEHIPLAKKAMEFLDNSPDPFHAVQTAIDLLEDAGFTELQDIEPSTRKVQPGTLHAAFGM
jgi:aspartyl aminopeptidase